MIKIHEIQSESIFLLFKSQIQIQLPHSGILEVSNLAKDLRTDLLCYSTKKSGKLALAVFPVVVKKEKARKSVTF